MTTQNDSAKTVELPILERSVPERSCGECQECCFHINIPSVPSPASTRCPHQCDGGCAIYNDRPKPCATYVCSFLDGQLSERFRPDKCGVLFETTWVDFSETERFFLIIAMEMRPDAWDDIKPRLLNECRDDLAITFITGQGQVELLTNGQECAGKATAIIKTMLEGDMTMRMADGVEHKLGG